MCAFDISTRGLRKSSKNGLLTVSLVIRVDPPPPHPLQSTFCDFFGCAKKRLFTVRAVREAWANLTILTRFCVEIRFFDTEIFQSILRGLKNALLTPFVAFYASAIPLSDHF